MGKHSVLLGIEGEKLIPVETNHEGLRRVKSRKDSVYQQLCKVILEIQGRDRSIRDLESSWPQPLDSLSLLPATTSDLSAILSEPLPRDCPVCCTLHPSTQPTGPEAPALDYCIELDPVKRRLVKVWSRRCVLANFVTKMASSWLGEHEDVTREFGRENFLNQQTCHSSLDDRARLYLNTEHGSVS